MISTKGRYSIRILLDLAEHRNGSYIPMKDVAARQNISLKYIERLMPALKAAGLVDSVHGIGGGYRLTRSPDQYTVEEILNLTEGNLAPVSCLEDRENQCERCNECATLDFWTGLYAAINQYIDRFTLADLVSTEQQKNHRPRYRSGC